MLSRSFNLNVTRNSDLSQGYLSETRGDQLVLRRDENIVKILALGVEEKFTKSTLLKVNLSDALMKVLRYSDQLTLK